MNLKKMELFENIKTAYGEKMDCETYWGWRYSYKDCTVEREEVSGTNKVKLTYPCGHNDTVHKLKSREYGKMILANFHTPFCTKCRVKSYAANREKEQKRNDAFKNLGIVSVEDELDNAKE